MLTARAGALLLCAAAATLIGGCTSTRVSPAAPGVSLAGSWKVDPSASDDLQKTLAQMRAQALKIIARNAPSAQARGNGAAADALPAEDAAPARGPRRDPLQHSPMAHVIRAMIERGDFLTVRQTPGEIVFDYGTSRRSFTPGAHSVVSAEGGVGDQTSGWNGRSYLISIRAQNGPAVTETYALSADGGHLVQKLHIGAYELPAVDVTRTYVPTSEAAPRQLPTSD